MLELLHERHQKTALRYNSQSWINIWGPGFSQEAEMSQSIIRSTMQTHPSIDSELLADWDLAWDYTPGLDLTFLVFFECKHAHRPTCRGLTPLLKKKRADPMLSDPNLPRLPLPTATSLCSLSLFFFFISMRPKWWEDGSAPIYVFYFFTFDWKKLLPDPRTNPYKLLFHWILLWLCSQMVSRLCDIQAALVTLSVVRS